MGTFFLFQAALSFLAIPADMTINKAIQKRMSEEEAERRSVLATGLLVKVVLLLVVSAAILVARARVNAYIGADLALYLVVGLLLLQGSRLATNVISGELRVSVTGPIELAKTVVWIGTAVYLVSTGAGITGIIVALLGGYGVLLVLGVWTVDTVPGVPSREKLLSLLTYSKELFISQVASRCYAWADVAIIGFFLANDKVGIYNTAWFVSGSLLLFNRALSTSIFPQISQWEADDDREAIVGLLPKLFVPSLVFVVPGLFGAVVVGRPGLAVFFGEEFATGWLVLIVLLGERIVSGIKMPFESFLQAIDAPELASRAAVVGLGANVFLNLVLIWAFGIVGAAVASLTATILYAAIEIYYASSFVDIVVPLRRVGWILVSASVMTVVLDRIAGMVAMDSIPSVVLVILLGGATYFGVLILNPSIRHRARVRADQLVGP